MRTKVVDGSKTNYGIGTTWSEINNYNNSWVRTQTNDFYGSLSSTSALRQNAVTHDATSKLGVYASLDNASGISIPTQTKATGTTDIAFLLSFQEYASYCSLYWNIGIGINPDSPAGAKTNWNLLKTKGDGGTTGSWLRTIGNSTSSASMLSYPGGVGCNGLTDSTNYVRPALWVKSDIIDNLP